jgi:hypothetical protein
MVSSNPNSCGRYRGMERVVMIIVAQMYIEACHWLVTDFASPGFPSPSDEAIFSSYIW